jgi:signal transduction histidine kinase
MQPDSGFVDNFVAAVQDEQSLDVHDVWVNTRLAQDFMQNTRVTLRTGLLVIALTTLLLYDHVNTWILIAWCSAAAAILLYRYHTIRAFNRLMDKPLKRGALPDVERFFRRHGWSWLASAIAFAFPVFFYFDQIPLANQYLCLLIFVSVGLVGSLLTAVRIQSQRGFAHALCSTMLLAVATHWFLAWPVLPALTSVVLFVLVAIFWILILFLGRHFYALQRESYSAQFRHEQLIFSLRQQTQASTEAIQTKNNILASAAHDLRQPVHALAFYADWLRNEPQVAEVVIPKILAATDSVNTLFNSLFDFAKIEAGAIKIQLQDVDITELVTELANQFAPAADVKGLYLHTSPLKTVVRSDPILLRRITGNLLANAIRYTEQGGVMLNVQKVGNRLWIEISDTGVGIATEHLPHVFKEFYRAAAHEGTADGFGLGLAIVKRLCSALGYAVTLSSALGQGTSCRIEIDTTHKPV